MRNLVPLALCLATACSRQIAPKDVRLAGIERSVFVLSIVEDRARMEEKDMVVYRGQSLLTTSRTDPLRSDACNAVYVTKHLLATSASSFARKRYRKAVHLPDVRVLDGDVSRGVDEVVLRDGASGLALLRTEEAGVPIEPAREAPSSADRLTYLAHEIMIEGGSGAILVADWKVGPIQALRVPDDEQLCGAAVIDEGRRLVGVVIRDASGALAVLPVQDILEKARAAGAL